MPTTITKIVDPDNGPGTDYLSLNAWEAGQQADLVAADQIQVAECRSTSGTADTSALTLAGWTTDATRYIEIRSTGSNRHAGVWDASKYRLVVTGSGGNCITATAVQNVRLNGLQIEHIRNADVGAAPVLSMHTNVRIFGCIVRSGRTSGTNSNSGLNFSNNAGVTGYVYNNLFICGDTAVNVDIAINAATTTGTVYVENNTIVRGNSNTNAIGLAGGSATIARNNLVYNYGNTNSYNGTFGTGTDNNTTNSTDSIGTGSNNHTSQTFTFTNSAGGDYSLAAGDTGARDQGTALAGISAGFTDDIRGVLRDASGAIDCGAFEFVIAGQPAVKRMGGVPFAYGGPQPKSGQMRW